MKKKIYYYHTDCGGVVYYGNYLAFLEEARTEYLALRGISVKQLSEEGTLFVVARQEIDYRFPAVYGDTLQIDAQITEIGGARINFEYQIKNQADKLVAEARTVLVCVDDKLKPKAIPEAVRAKIDSV